MKLKQPSISHAICYLSLILFLEPPIFTYIPQLGILSKLFAAARYVLSFLAVGYSVLRFPKHGKLMLSLCIVLQGLSVFAAYMNGTLYGMFVLSCFTKIGFVLINIEFYDKIKNKLIWAYAKVLGIYILLHMFLQLVYPKGFSGSGDGRSWFLGLKNTATIYFLVFIMCFIILQQIGEIKPKTMYKLLIFTNLAVIINRSSTTIAVAFLFTAYIIVYYTKWRQFLAIFNFRIIFILLCVFFVVIVYMAQESAFTEWIGALFGKNATFSGRTAIWKLAVKYFQSSMLWGVGIDAEFRPWANPYRVVYSAHNSILEFLCKYGIFVAAMFIVICIVIFMRCIKIKDKNLQKTLTVAFLLFFLASLFEAQGNHYLFWSIAVIPYFYTKSSKYKMKK